MHTGIAHLPLHGGKAPMWLFSRMVKLAREIVRHVVTGFGSDEMLCRLSDPFWFQALGCVLGFDWHSSGVTTTTCGAIKEGIKGLERELGFFACGGKGGTSRKTPQEITVHCDRLSHDPASLVYASRMSAKVDNSCVQNGFQLYHHCFFFTSSGKWCVVQQGMNEVTGMARRYHWLSEKVPCFVNEPHAAVCCDAQHITLNLVASESENTRKASALIATLPSRETLLALQKLPRLDLPVRHQVCISDINPKYLEKILLKTYERKPPDFESLVGTEGVGPKTLRALALAAELIYGARASTRDPARFSFAHGGKDGIPYPVDRATYENTITVLHDAVDKARIDTTDKMKALKRLAFIEQKGSHPFEIAHAPTGA